MCRCRAWCSDRYGHIADSVRAEGAVRGTACSAYPRPFCPVIRAPDSSPDWCIPRIHGLHSQVVAQRFGEEVGWKLRGYSLAFLFPQIGGWTWQEIADLRRDRDMARFRAKLRDIEDEAAAGASGGDLEAAVRHAYERHSAAAVPKLTGVGRAAATIVAGYVISSGSGLMTFGLKAVPADLASAAAGSAPGRSSGSVKSTASAGHGAG